MPIYAYRCESCGFEKDVLQKMSDAPLTHCPQCSNDTFRKQVTAAGFQLKGSGWYVTDFRGGSNGANAGAKAADGAESAKGEGGKAEPAAASTGAAAAPAASAPSSSGTASATPAATGGTGA